MRRYEKLKDIFYQNIEEKCHGLYKQKAYFHSLQVCALCKDMAIKKGLDIELAAIIGLFHDYSQFINHSSFNHASLSADMIKPYLSEFSDEDIFIITNSIAKHSDKDKIDDVYCEMIKDADVYAQYLEEPDMIMKPENKKRLKGITDL